ncbi:MAG: ABC transporter ATP-binding protein [Candidatus Norongarragalinales archaeon]
MVSTPSAKHRVSARPAQCKKPADSPLIELRNVCKTYYLGGEKTRSGAQVPALRGVNLVIRRGEFVAIMGPSGSGKSTLMNCVGALDLPSEGSILLDGKDIAGLSESDLATVRGQKIGFVFQNFNLIQSLTAYENAELPLLFQDIDEDERRARLDALFARVGLSERQNHKPTELSGGEQQRVAFVRALAVNPELILADEPTGNLDSRAGAEIMALLKELNEEGKTIVVVSHDPGVVHYARRVVRLKDGEIVSQ